MCLGSYKVAILGVYDCGGGSLVNLKVEVSCMCCVCRGRQVFGEDVAWVSICSYSPDVNIPLQIVLAHSVMTDVNAAGMLVLLEP